MAEPEIGTNIEFTNTHGNTESGKIKSVSQEVDKFGKPTGTTVYSVVVPPHPKDPIQIPSSAEVLGHINHPGDNIERETGRLGPRPRIPRNMHMKDVYEGENNFSGGENNFSKSGGGSGCFITTAVCKTLNRPDDCVELAAFRHFRDTFMRETAEMRAEVEEYYVIAPQICVEIDKTGTASAKYAAIWEDSLKPAFSALDAGDNQKAHDIYKDMVLGLKQEYLEL